MPESVSWKRFSAAAQLLAGAMAVLIIILALQHIIGFVQVQSVPPGWQIIRPPQEVAALLIVNDTVWTGGKDGLIIVDRANGSQVALPAGTPSFGYVRQILMDRDGWIWVGHDRGLARYRNRAWEIIAPAPGVPFTGTLSLAERHDGTIIAGTGTDVLAFRDGSWSSLVSGNSPAIACAEVLFEDRDSNLWAGCGLPTHGGLYRLNGTTWSSFTLDDGLPHLSVRGMTQTRDGTVWVATGYASHGGAALYSGGRWSVITVDDGLAGGCTRSVYEDAAGRMWVGSEYDGIAVGAPGAWRILTEKDGLAGDEVKMMVQDAEGTYWLGTDGGLNRVTDSALFPSRP